MNTRFFYIDTILCEKQARDKPDFPSRGRLFGGAAAQYRYGFCGVPTGSCGKNRGRGRQGVKHYCALLLRETFLFTPLSRYRADAISA